MSYSVNHRREGKFGKFYIEIEGEEAELEYELLGDLLIAYHTYTPPKLRGRGVASAMTKALIDMALQEGLKIKPLCSYVSRYLEGHKELSGLVAR